MGFLRSKTKEGPAPEPYNLPQTGYQFAAPVTEDIGRRLLSSYFGAPGYYEGMISRPTPVPIEQTAGLTPLQMQARGLSQRLGGFGGQLQEAQNLYRGQAGATQRGMGSLEDAQRFYETSTAGFNPYSGIGAYMNPYENQVVQQTISDITEQSQLGDIGRRAQAVGAGAFGGARSRLQEQESQRALGRGLGETIGGLRSRGYEGARQAAMNEFARQAGAYQTAGQGLAGIGSQFGQLGGALGSAGAGIAGLGGQGFGQLQSQINLMNQLGQQGQGTQQAGLTRQYQAAQQMAQEPFMRMQRGVGMLQGIGPMMGGFTGGTGSQLGQTPTYQQPSTFSNVLGAASTIAGMFPSDMLLKDNVRHIGQTDGGANVFAWEWNDTAKRLGIEDQPEFGVIAQDLVQTHPDAVSQTDDGYLVVDYRRIS